jgi:hypothetical protein
MIDTNEMGFPIKLKAALRAPVIPAAIFTGMMLVGGGTFGVLAQTIQGYAPATKLLGYGFVLLISYAGFYLIGLLLTTVFGVLFLTLVPGEIPLLSWLNRSRSGRLVMIFSILIMLAFLNLGSGFFLLLLTLMCVGEYTKKLPNTKGSNGKSDSVFY